jgi:hypothetical protein
MFWKFASLLLITLFLYFVLPFNLQAHYIFPLTSLLFLTISQLPKKLLFPVIITLAVIYLNPKKLKTYFTPAPRTYDQMNTCFAQFCPQFKKPLFVSVNSNLYPYHYGPEFRYLLAKNGCLVKNIETEPNGATTMAVILDSATFSPQTRYYELDLFGKFNLTKRLTCTPNLSVQIINKTTTP